MAEMMRMPEVAAGSTSAILSEWLVNEGDAVSVGDPIATIETDKAVVEIEAETAAVMLKFLVTASSQIEVGAPIALLGQSAEAPADVELLLRELGVAPSAAPSSGRQPCDVEVSTDAPLGGLGRQTIAEGEVSSPVEEVHNDPSTLARRFISPIARRMLREADIDSSRVTGTGPGGRIVRNDVDRAIAAAPPAARDSTAIAEAPAPSSSRPSRAEAAVNPADDVGYTSIPHSRLRQTIANRLTSSKQTVPHFYLKRQAVIDELLTLRKELNTRTSKRLSVNDFVLRAAAHAHTEVPQVNAIWTDEAIRQYDSVDIAVAIASERGLVTPVLRSVEATSLGNISMQVREFVSQANNGKLKQGDLEGGSITITNLGMYGVDEFSAIINPPHSSILAVGAGKLQPVVANGNVETATVMSLVLSVDHRAIDGALAAQWMEALVTALENPLTLLV